MFNFMYIQARIQEGRTRHAPQRDWRDWADNRSRYVKYHLR